MKPLHFLTAGEAAARVAHGDLSVSAIAEASIARIRERQPAVQAYAYLDETLIRAQAAAHDGAPVRKPLHGVTLGIKDVIDTRDMPTQQNSPRYFGAQTGVDAACVDTLREAGALLLGKTVTTEFAATGRGGPTRNPHDLARTPGGSSSGSGAAVADGQAMIALGTQTGGSTIRPASFNGIFGWKPTWNVISREGLKMYSATCDTLGLYARAAEDFELLADVFDLDQPEAPLPLTLEGLRVGVCRSPVWARAAPEMQKALADGAASLASAGAVVSDLDLPGDFDAIHDAHRKIMRVEGHAAFLNEVRNTPGIADEFKAIVERRDGVTPSQARQAYRLADRCRALFDDIACEYDIILTPSAAGEAPVGIETTGDASFNSMWTLLQVPVVNVPGFAGPNAMPLGLSLVSRRFQDRKVIAVGKLAAPHFRQTRSGD
jgi:Asp-tRNA(Asn)/Glu-tRNA(Gln) amidotransferase A subunit family amidase